MQGITAMKVPDKYEPKNTDEFGTFDRAMTKLLAVPAAKCSAKSRSTKSARRNLNPANPALPAILHRFVESLRTVRLGRAAPCPCQ